jgi:hypothetical protein
MEWKILTNWIHHGEDLDIGVIEQPVDMHMSDDAVDHDGNMDAVRFAELLEGLHTVAVEEGRIDTVLKLLVIQINFYRRIIMLLLVMTITFFVNQIFFYMPFSFNWRVRAHQNIY